MDDVTRLAREHAGRVTAILTARFNDLDLADEAVQDALIEAVESWPRRGVPDKPSAWLMTVARRKAIDRLRRESSARRRVEAVAADPIESTHPALERHLIMESTEIPDEQLRLVLLCCHPALNRDAQVALTLRLVGGLTTPEIASAYFVPEATITQRIVRAKRKIKQAGIPLSIPANLDERIDAAEQVLYLIFNEGYLSRGADQVIRVNLADEAIRLTAVLNSLLPQRPELLGLLALMLFHRARFSTRTDSGELLRLQDQDRSRWDRDQIRQANTVLQQAISLRQPGPRQLEAVIASLHANAATYPATDWARIATAYGQLVAMTGSPIVRLNHAVAVGMADGALAGLALLDDLEFSDYHLLHACRADLLERAGCADEARAAFTLAAELVTNDNERRYLEARLRGVRDDDSSREQGF